MKKQLATLLTTLALVGTLNACSTEKTQQTIYMPNDRVEIVVDGNLNTNKLPQTKQKKLTHFKSLLKELDQNDTWNQLIKGKEGTSGETQIRELNSFVKDSRFNGERANVTGTYNPKESITIIDYVLDSTVFVYDAEMKTFYSLKEAPTNKISTEFRADTKEIQRITEDWNQKDMKAQFVQEYDGVYVAETFGTHREKTTLHRVWPEALDSWSLSFKENGVLVDEDNNVIALHDGTQLRYMQMVELTE